jgi:fructoselysine-6-P-deglycase FrlB-like protein
MSEIAHEIATQPDTWRRAIAVATTDAAEDALPAAGERVAVIGCGTSWFIGQSYAALREAAGLGEADAFTPIEMPGRRRYERAVAISRSGTTTEVIRCLERLRDAGVRTAAITAAAGSPITLTADRSLILDFADERSVVQTRFATAALTLLRVHIGHDAAPMLGDVERALGDPLPVDVTAFDHFVFLGHGWSVGLANEAALKLREAAQVHTESYPAMEYRHGPVSLVGPSSLVWILGTPDPTVADEIAAVGATVRIAELDALAELVVIHRAAVALAAARGLDPDHPRHLTRSVVLS